MIDISYTNAMEIVHMKGFVALAEAGSVTAAAGKLCLTQSAVTQQLQALEKNLGVKLFDRTPRGVVLTQAGVAFLGYAQRSLAVLEEGCRAALDIEQGHSGSLLIGAGVTTSVFRLPAWLTEFQAQYPEVEIVVRTGRSAEVAALVADHHIDVGIVTTYFERPDLTSTALFDEDVVLVQSARVFYPTTIELDRLPRVPMIVFTPNTGFRAYLDRTLIQYDIALRVRMESDSVEAIKSFVAVGLGASFLPASAVAAELVEGSMVAVEVIGLPHLRRQTAAVYRTTGHLNAAAQGFLRIIRGANTEDRSAEA